MSESLDDDPPFEQLPPATPTPMTEGEEMEFSVLSAVMGDPDGRLWADARDLPASAFRSEEAAAVWSAWQAGVSIEDVVTLASRVRLSIARVLEIGAVDRAGATFSSGIKALRARHRDDAVRKLANELHKSPDLLEQIGPQLVRLAGTGAGVLQSRPLSEFRLLPRNDRSVLLGNRYLVRGDGAVMAGTSGMGKSSLSLQMAVLWALARDAFGIKPNGGLVSLVFQAEDSEGDVAEVWASLVHELKLTDEELAIVRARVIIVTDRLHRGDSFIAEARRQVALHKPDLVWVNPLAAFMGGDISDAQEASRFLREQLNGLNADCSFAWVLVHHTTKPPSDKGKSERKWSEVMYDMAGSYDLIGWARAILSLRATDTPGEFDLVLAKRGTRADVKIEKESEAGIPMYERTTKIPLRHADREFAHPDTGEKMPVIFWEGRMPSAAEKSVGKKIGRPSGHVFSTYAAAFPTKLELAQGIRVIHRRADVMDPISQTTFVRLVKEAVADGAVQKDISDPLQPKYWVKA